MIRGLYTGASGMIAQQGKMDAVSNNIANADKTGYKKDEAIFKAFPDMIIRRLNDDGLGKFPLGSYDTMPFVGKLGTGVELNEVYTRMDQGALQPSSNKFDFALDGKGFFTVKTERGEAYSRNGSFTINEDGILMNHNGNPVLGEKGIIKVQQNNFIVNEKGEIVVNGDMSGDPQDLIGMNENEWQNPIVLDRLKIVNFENPRLLKKVGESKYIETEYSGPAYQETKASVKQGYLEKSNVNIVKEMVNMIEVQRSYEANQRSITTADTTVGKLINEVAR